MKKTIISIKPFTLNDEFLVSRSQARRIVKGLDEFDEIVFDFSNVKSIAQAFADEIFRVFRNNHPNIKIFPINTNKSVSKMITWIGFNSNENVGGN